MRIINIEQAKGIDFKRASVALGTFDGLHKGHMALVEAAKKHDGDTVAFTFDALPADVFKKSHKPMQLYTLDEKKHAFETTGIDYLCIAHFDKKFAGIDKHEFEKMLSETFSPCCVIAGYNYTYGRNAEGNASELQKDSSEFGYSVEVIPEVIVNGRAVSSTVIRQMLWKGDVESANSLLGYMYSIGGTVVEGSRIGTSLGFPTANLMVPSEKIVPKSGVYAVQAVLGEKKYNAVCNIGTKPTVAANAALSVEVHIMDFEGDVYGSDLRINFKKRLRSEKRFESRQMLSEQIKKDIEKARLI